MEGFFPTGVYCDGVGEASLQPELVNTETRH